MPRRLFALIAALLALGVEVAAVSVSGDANWDLRNYHLYAPFALLHKQFGVDIAPAHMQTWFSPTLDLVYYGLARSITSTPLLNALLALPQALAVVLAFALTWRLLRPRSALEGVALGLCTVIGATGAAAGSTLATTSSEMLPTCLVLLALLRLVPADLDRVPRLSHVAPAGLLFGAACGLKLTFSYVTVAGALALLLIPASSVVDRLRRPVVFGLGVGLGAVALSGYWWVLQYQHFGNPFFPLMNNIFRSPLAVPDSFVDRTFLPRSLADGLSGPWAWALRLSLATSESRLRDPRFSIALVAAAVALVSAGSRRPRWRPWAHAVLPAFFIAAFVLWRLQFSIYRYLAVVELLTGTMLALGLFPIARAWARPRLGAGPLATGASALALAACLVVTVFPNLNRAAPGAPPLAVDLGPLPPDSTVLLLDNEPMAYLAAFADPRIRFIGTHDFYMPLDSGNPMQPLVEAAIRDASGPLWGLDSPQGQGGSSDETLARYGLTRGACRPVRTNISLFAIRLCRLARPQS